jgi:hypothetical protein
VTNKGAPRQPARGRAPGDNIRESADFAARVRKNRARAKLARAARRKNRR